MSLAEEVGLRAEVLLDVFSAEERQGLAPKENSMEDVFGQNWSKKHLGRSLIFVQRRFDLFGQKKLRVVCDFQLGCVALYFLSNQSEQHVSLKAISPLRIKVFFHWKKTTIQRLVFDRIFFPHLF